MKLLEGGHERRRSGHCQWGREASVRYRLVHMGRGGHVARVRGSLVDGAVRARRQNTAITGSFFFSLSLSPVEPFDTKPGLVPEKQKQKTPTKRGETKLANTNPPHNRSSTIQESKNHANEADIQFSPSPRQTDRDRSIDRASERVAKKILGTPPYHVVRLLIESRFF